MLAQIAAGMAITLINQKNIRQQFVEGQVVHLPDKLLRKNLNCVKKALALNSWNNTVDM